MIKAVLFDLDGTLLNRDESLKLFADKQYDRFSHLIGPITKDVYTARLIQLDSRGYVWKDKVYSQLAEEFGIIKITWQELLEDYLSEFKYCCVPFDNLLFMLEKLKERKMLIGMITNGFGQFQMDNIMALGIEDYFQTILISEWEDVKKPDPQIFLRAADKLGLQPNECVFIGDHPDNDIRAAKHIGMKSIWKKDMQWKDVDVQAEYIVGDLMEIPTIIDELVGGKNGKLSVL
ncbi:MAG: HAD family hydrolase [Psychrobacillus psychrotolerans]|uniref:HAD family hydrolase n=1 Tax=Psychrobacillus psychrotolerans TaxID=126156 RepID=UPI003BB204A3